MLEAVVSAGMVGEETAAAPRPVNRPASVWAQRDGLDCCFRRDTRQMDDRSWSACPRQVVHVCSATSLPARRMRVDGLGNPGGPRRQKHSSALARDEVFAVGSCFRLISAVPMNDDSRRSGTREPGAACLMNGHVLGRWAGASL
jgi:hypothetical protein